MINQIITLEGLSKSMKSENILNDLDNGLGYSLGIKIKDEEFVFLLNTIEKKFLDIVVKNVDKNIAKRENISFLNNEMNQNTFK